MFYLYLFNPFFVTKSNESCLFNQLVTIFYYRITKRQLSAIFFIADFSYVKITSIKYFLTLWRLEQSKLNYIGCVGIKLIAREHINAIKASFSNGLSGPQTLTSYSIG